MSKKSGGKNREAISRRARRKIAKNRAKLAPEKKFNVARATGW